MDTPKKGKPFLRAFFFVYRTLGPWQRGSLCVCISRVNFVCVCVCVCEVSFSYFILGVTTNYWFCIRCDWSPICLILFLVT